MLGGDTFLPSQFSILHHQLEHSMPVYPSGEQLTKIQQSFVVDIQDMISVSEFVRSPEGRVDEVN